jgi:uncharacterized protein YutE (UPF0331/DUF86 family)
VIDPDLVLSKSAAVKRHLERIARKTAGGRESFQGDADRQDIVAFNLHLAVENCIDIAAHLISENGWGVPGTASEMFYTLEDKAVLNAELTEKMIKAVGLRNLIVHEYARIDVTRLFDIVRSDLGDLTDYLAAVLAHMKINPSEL